MPYRTNRLSPRAETLLLRFFWVILLAIVANYVLEKAAVSQTVVAVTGHLGDASGQPVQGLDLKFQLANCGGNQPRVVGHFGIIKAVVDLIPDATTGIVTGNIWPNDVINCGGTTGGTFYYLTPILNNVPQGPAACYQITTSQNPFNLDTATPCASIPGPPSPTPPIDATYNNLNVVGFFSGTAGRFTGQLEVGSILLDNPPAACPSGQFTTGITNVLGLNCATPSYPGAPVTTVFGRAGGVLAVSGDYTCSQVTGCPTSALTALHGAVTASGPGDAAATLSSTGVSAGTYTSPSSMTLGVDGRVSAITSGTALAATCNSNGCYYALNDGTIEAWGRTTLAPGSGTIAALTATFPVTLPSTSNLVITATPVGQAVGDGNPHPIECHVDSFSTSSATVYISIPLQVGGSGYSHLASSQYCAWHASAH